jgi:hypothetical protein
LQLYVAAVAQPALSCPFACQQICQHVSMSAKITNYACQHVSKLDKLVDELVGLHEQNYPAVLNWATASRTGTAA